MKQKNVLVSGASSGIGLAISHHLALHGFKVYAGFRHDKDREGLKELSSNVIPVPLDVTDSNQVQGVCQRLARETGEDGLYGLVNNAGIALMGPLETLPLATYRLAMETNYLGMVSLTQATLPLLKKAKGRIINMSSTSGFVAWPYASAYVASKFAVEGLSDVLRLELKPYGIKVCLVQPGAVKTAIWNKIGNDVNQQLAALDHGDQARLAHAMRQQQHLIKKSTKGAIAASEVAVVVAEALACLQPKARYLVGPSARLQKILLRLLSTRCFDALKYRLVRQRV